MGAKLTPPDMDLYRAVDEVLHYVWDPVGAGEHPEARDEYYAYLPQVFAMVRDNATAEQLADHLAQLATEQIGLPHSPEHHAKAAHLLVQWRDVVRRRYAGQSSAA